MWSALRRKKVVALVAVPVVVALCFVLSQLQSKDQVVDGGAPGEQTGGLGRSKHRFKVLAPTAVAAPGGGQFAEVGEDTHIHAQRFASPKDAGLLGAGIAAEQYITRKERSPRKVLTAAAAGGRGAGSNVVQLHDCVAAVDGLLVHPTEGLTLLLPRNVRQHVSTLRFCSIASTTAAQLQFPMKDAPKNNTAYGAAGWCSGPHRSSGVASVSLLERPQHAMQFLFSILGATAMQDSYGFDYYNDIAVVSLATYGRFSTWADIGRWDRYPHMELLQLLSKRGVVVVGQQRAAIDVEMIVPVEHTPTGSQEMLHAGVRWNAAWIKWNSSSAEVPPPLPCIAPTALFGGLPVRVLHYKKQELRRHVIEDWHFTNFRLRLLDHFGIPAVRDPRLRHVLIVVRKKQRRRLILNHDALVAVVASIGVGYQPVVVDWQGMSLRDQLQLALNANAIVGMHGNGHVWDCFMPAGGLMVEFSSDLPLRNEVGAGQNRRNVGNVAGLCPIESYSFRSRAVANEHSLHAPPSHTWKEVDVVVSELQLKRLREILVDHHDRHVVQRAKVEGFTAHVG